MSLLELSPLERRNNQTQELKDELKNIGFLYKKKIIQNRELRNIYKCMCKTVWIEHRKGIEKIDNRSVLIFSNVPLEAANLLRASRH